MSQLPDLYHSEILRHSRSPVNFQADGSGAMSFSAINQLCGDKYVVRFDLHDHFAKVNFYGNGCAISKAATSMLVEILHDKTLDETIAICQQQLSFLRGQSDTPPLEQLAVFGPARNHPGRLKCATLCWEAFLQECGHFINAKDDSL